MQQPQLTTYADITEVRTVTGAAACNQLLADGWVLLGIYPLTTVGEMTEGASSDGQQQKQPQDTQRYVRGLVDMWWERGENRKSSQLPLCLCLIIIMMIDTTYVGCQNTPFGWFEGLVRML